MKLVKVIPDTLFPKEDPSETTIYSKTGTVVILTESGKPVYISHGPEHMLTPLTATYSILLNKFSQNLDPENPHTPLFFENGKRLQVFHKAGRLWLVYVALERKHSPSFLMSLLRLLVAKVG
jgi:hypothetical protein